MPFKEGIEHFANGPETHLTKQMNITKRRYAEKLEKSIHCEQLCVVVEWPEISNKLQESIPQAENNKQLVDDLNMF